MFLVAYTGVRTNTFSADWKPMACFRNTSRNMFGVCRWTIRRWCMKFGIAHHNNWPVPERQQPQYCGNCGRNAVRGCSTMIFSGCRIPLLIRGHPIRLHLQTEAPG